MRLQVTTDKNNRWMQLLDIDGKIKSTRPATTEEVWMFGELDSRIVENNLMENRIAGLESDLAEARMRAGAAEEALANARYSLEELESAIEENRKQYEDIIRDLEMRVQDLENDDKGRVNRVF